MTPIIQTLLQLKILTLQSGQFFLIKSANPRAFNDYKLPVVYKATNKGWMSTSFFVDWFKNLFILEVKGFLTQVNRPLKALLILDNAPSHSKTDEIKF